MQHAINRVHKFLWSDVKIDFYHSKNCPSRIVYDHNSNVFYHLRPKNSYCKQYDTNVVAHLKTIGILATPCNDLRIFKTRFKYDLRTFYFINRVVDAWNSLPNWIVMANSINTFKYRLDICWQDQEILVHSYREPDVVVTYLDMTK